jgi:hypothetical protein
MSTPAELLQQSLTALRNAKRFSHTSNSYRKDNPAEYAKVIAYLDGGARPPGSLTEMGKHAVLEEDAACSTRPPPPGNSGPGHRPLTSPITINLPASGGGSLSLDKTKATYPTSVTTRAA